MQETAGGGDGGASSDQIVEHLLFFAADDRLVGGLLLAEELLDGLAVLAGREHALAGLGEAGLGFVQLALGLPSAFIQPMAVGEGLGGVQGWTTEGQIVQPALTGIIQLALHGAKLTGRVFPLAENLAVTFQCLLLGSLAEG